SRCAPHRADRRVAGARLLEEARADADGREGGGSARTQRVDERHDDRADAPAEALGRALSPSHDGISPRALRGAAAPHKMNDELFLLERLCVGILHRAGEIVMLSHLRLFESLQSADSEKACTMMDGQNLGMFGLQPIDDAIVSQDDFAQGRIASFRHNSSSFRVLSNALSGTDCVGHEPAGVCQRVSGNEVSDGLKVSSGLGSPPYFNHLAIFCFSLAWEMVRPASASLMPSSIFERNTNCSMASS